MNGIVACLRSRDYEKAPVDICLLFIKFFDMNLEVGDVCPFGFTRLGQYAFGITKLPNSQSPTTLDYESIGVLLVVVGGSAAL